MSSRTLVSFREVDRPAGHLFCLHHAGGADSAFRPWAKLLREDVALTATLLPGRGRRFGEPLPTTLEAAADEVADAILGAWPRPGVPVIIFGHSLGGLMAYEVERRLESSGRRASRVVISGVTPDHRQQRRDSWSDEEFRRLIRSMGGTPPELLEHEGLMALAIPILRNDFRVVDTYRPRSRPQLIAPITAVGGTHDENAEVSGLHGWKECTSSDFAVETFPGGHFYLDEHRADVVRWLQEHLVERGALPGSDDQA